MRRTGYKMAQVDRITEELQKLIENLATNISLEVTANLIEETPVDIGWARANWVPSIGAPVDNNAESVEDPNSQNVASQRSQQQSAIANVATNYRLEKGDVYICNNVPYITKLNDGSSRKAPRGFVQQSIAKGIVEGVRKGTRS